MGVICSQYFFILWQYFLYHQLPTRVSLKKQINDGKKSLNHCKPTYDDDGNGNDYDYDNDDHHDLDDYDEDDEIYQFLINSWRGGH